MRDDEYVLYEHAEEEPVVGEFVATVLYAFCAAFRWLFYESARAFGQAQAENDRRKAER